MSLLNALGAIARSTAVGAVRAAENKHYTKPEVRRAMNKRAMEKAQACTPCAAAAYVQDLHKQYGG